MKGQIVGPPRVLAASWSRHIGMTAFSWVVSHETMSRTPIFAWLLRSQSGSFSVKCSMIAVILVMLSLRNSLTNSKMSLPLQISGSRCMFLAIASSRLRSCSFWLLHPSLLWYYPWPSWRGSFFQNYLMDCLYLPFVSSISCLKVKRR